MAARTDALQHFIDAVALAFGEVAEGPESQRSIERIFTLLKEPGAQRPGPGSTLPVCSHLPAALKIETDHELFLNVVARFKDIEPSIEWRGRAGADKTASANFAEGHANAMIIGPGGLEERPDLWLGVSLMAPHVRYPDHNHPPEETYFVLSEGDFLHGDSGWFTPGVGGTLYNEPNITHAMRSGEKPLFAFWALLAEGPDGPIGLTIRDFGAGARA